MKGLIKGLEPKEYYKKWRKEHKGYSTKVYQNLEQDKKKKFISNIVDNQRSSAKRKRNEILDILGWKCQNCGFSDRRCLQIDHSKFSNGRKHLKNCNKNMTKYYSEILADINAGNKNYRVLCANCNWIKRYDNSEICFKKVIGVVSGFFDPIHEGHIEYFKKAKTYCDWLICIVNNDKQAVMKKGSSFMNENTRMEIIKSIKYIDEVILSVDTKDTTIIETLKIVKPNLLLKGGDRYAYEIPEKILCDELGIKIIDGLGAKIRSSSELVSNWKKSQGLNT